MITFSTTIKELLEEGVISQRAYNICAFERFETVLDLYKFQQNDDFYHLRNCGAKSVLEIKNAIKMAGENDSIESHIRPNTILPLSRLSSTSMAIIDNAFALNTTNSVAQGIVGRLFPSIVAFFNYLIGIEEIDIENVIHKHEVGIFDLIYAIQSVRGKINYVYTNLESKVGKDSDLYKAVSECRQKFLLKLPVIYKNSIIKLRSKEFFDFLTEKYQECINNAGVKGSKFLYEHLPYLSDGLNYIDRPIEELYEFCTGRNLTKTILAAKVALDSFSALIRSYMNYTQEELDDDKISTKFPFLYKGQRVFIQKYQQEKGCFPALYIIYHFIINSQNEFDSIVYALIGGEGIEPLSLEQVATKFNRSRERIRQIKAQYLDILSGYSFMKELDLSKYAFCELTCMPFEDKYIGRIVEEEKIRLSANSFALLVCLLFPVSIYEFCERKFLINRTLKNEVSRLVKKAQSLLYGSYLEDTTINLFADIKVSSSFEKRDLINVATYLLNELLGIRVHVSGKYTFKKNKFSIRQAIYEILRDNEKPTRIEELMNQYNEKYPDHCCDSVSNFRAHLLGDSRIKAIGKTSTYALIEWSNIFWGSIRDYLYEILDKSEEPLHIDTIVDKVLKIFPDTNKKNISSTMLGDDVMDRFVAFCGSYYGVTGKKYDEKYVRLPKRDSFEKRLNDLDTFAATFKRFPFSNGGAIESSLNRWYSRVINGALLLSNDQNALFEATISKYQDIPHNYDEFVIQKRCKEYRHFVDTHFQLPEKKGKGRLLFLWFEKTHANYFSLSDISKKYYKNLCQYLIDMGFVEREEVLYNEDYYIPICSNECQVNEDVCQYGTTDDSEGLSGFDEAQTLDEYKQHFSSLNVAYVNKKPAPHKAVLLMTLMRMIEESNISAPIIPYNEELSNHFNSVWKMYVSQPEFNCTLWMPFYYMKSEPFWNLVSSSEKDVNQMPISSETRLKEFASGAIISEDLFDLLQSKDNREALKQVLIGKYLTQELK